MKGKFEFKLILGKEEYKREFKFNEEINNPNFIASLMRWLQMEFKDLVKLLEKIDKNKKEK